MSETKLEDLKSLETLCRLNEQLLRVTREEFAQRVHLDEIAKDKTDAISSRIFQKLDEVKSDMGNFREEIDTRVEKCNKSMRNDLKENYVTKSQLTSMTDRITRRITWIGSLIAVAIIIAKFTGGLE